MADLLPKADLTADLTEDISASQTTIDSGIAQGDKLSTSTDFLSETLPAAAVDDHESENGDELVLPVTPSMGKASHAQQASYSPPTTTFACVPSVLVNSEPVISRSLSSHSHESSNENSLKLESCIQVTLTSPVLETSENLESQANLSSPLVLQQERCEPLVLRPKEEDSKESLTEVLDNLTLNDDFDHDSTLSPSESQQESVLPSPEENALQETNTIVRAKFTRIFEQLRNNRRTINIHYLQLCFVGPPFVGKTLTRNRLLNIIEDIQREQAQKIQVASCNQVLAFVKNGKWQSSKDIVEECQLVVNFLREKLLKNTTDEAAGNEGVAVDTLSSSQKASFEVSPVQETSLPCGKLAAAFDCFKDFLSTSSGDYSKFENLLGCTFLNIHDIGGQPGFLEMLPAMIRGPAMYLLCFNMSKDLEKRCSIHQSNARATTLDESGHSVKEIIFRIISSIANIRYVFSKPGLLHIESIPEFCEMFRQFKKIKPVVALIGTHKDAIKKDKYDEKFTKVNETLRNITRVFIKQNVRIACLGSTKFFPVDNESPGEGDILQIRDTIEKLFLGQFEGISLPIQPNWLLFGVILRTQYHIVTIDDCFLLGKVLCMDTEEVKFCLQYLHYCIGTLIYYPELSDNNWFKNHVICSPQVIFDSITRLILDSLRTLHSSEKCHFEDDNVDWFEKGLFYIESISMYFSATVKQDIKSNRLIPIRELVMLLKHIHLLSPVACTEPDDQVAYLMPAILDCAPQDELLNPPDPDVNDPDPLFITFKCGYVPTGVFCGLITLIVSFNSEKIFEGMEWKLKPKEVKQNRVSFYVHEVNVVTLLSHDRYYEIRVTHRQKGIDLHDLCTHVLCVILYVLGKVCGHITPIISFQCPCPKHKSASRNILCILKKGICLQCLCEDREVVTLRKSQEVWIGKHATIGSTARLEVLKFATTVFSFHWIKDGSRDPIPLSSKHNFLLFPKVREDDFGYYQCQVKKGEKVLFTMYRALYESVEVNSAVKNEEPSKPVATMTLDSEIHFHDFIYLADYFASVDLYLDSLGIVGGEKTDVKRMATNDSTRVAMKEALTQWHKRETSKATYNELIRIARSLKEEETARKIRNYFSSKYSV